MKTAIQLWSLAPSEIWTGLLQTNLNQRIGIGIITFVALLLGMLLARLTRRKQKSKSGYANFGNMGAENLGKANNFRPSTVSKDKIERYAKDEGRATNRNKSEPTAITSPNIASPISNIPVPETVQQAIIPKQKIRTYFYPTGAGELGPPTGSSSPSSNAYVFCIERFETDVKASLHITVGPRNTDNEVRIFDFVQSRYDRLKDYIEDTGTGQSSVDEDLPGKAVLKNGIWVVEEKVKVRFS